LNAKSRLIIFISQNENNIKNHSYISIYHHKMDSSFNIIAFIENNPISRLSNAYNNKFLIKIKENFTELEQQMFVSSFYCYLKYHPTNDYVIDLDDVWKWLGFSQKVRAKELIEKYFIVEKDFKYVLPNNQEQKNEGRGGHNKQTILLNINTFKLFCIKAETKKANEIHNYFVKLETLLQEIVQEETNELKLQLENANEKSNELKQQIENAKNEKNELLEENEMLKKMNNKKPIIYIYQTNTRKDEKYFLKIGSTMNFNQRAKPFNQTNPFGKMVFSVEIPKYNLKTIEFFIHELFKNYLIKQEMFDVDIDTAKYIIISLVNLLNLCEMKDQREQFSMLSKIVEFQTKVINKTENVNISKREISTQTDNIETETQTSTIQENVITEDKNEKTFVEFINNHCVVEPTAEVSTMDIQGLYRIVYKKAEKEVYHAFMEYLKKRFMFARLHTPNKNETTNGFRGLRLKELIYTESQTPSDENTFILNCCKFHPGAKVLMTDLLEEYKNWKSKLNKEFDEEADRKKLKDYLNKTNYVFFSSLWHNNGSGQGYYGLVLNKQRIVYERKTSSTAKMIEKRDYITDDVINTWTTIKQASIEEGVSAAKMSRAVKNRIIFHEKYYFTEK